jgi:hypothetical protein
LVVREAAPPSTIPADGEPEFGNGESAEQPTSVAIVGDSFMVSALPGFRTVLDEAGITLVEAAFPACPIGHEPLANYDGEPHFKADECVTSTGTAYEWLLDHPADVVVWHDLQSVLPRFGGDGDLLEAGTSEWRDDLVEEWSGILAEFTNRQMDVIVLVPPLRSQDANCASAESEKRCRDIRSQDETIREATEAFRLANVEVEGVYFLDVDDLLCPSGVPCPVRIEGIAVREGGTDQTHFTARGAEWFAGKVFPLVVGLPNN